jgi:hypothetical protein
MKNLGKIWEIGGRVVLARRVFFILPAPLLSFPSAYCLLMTDHFPFPRFPVSPLLSFPSPYCLLLTDNWSLSFSPFPRFSASPFLPLFLFPPTLRLALSLQLLLLSAQKLISHELSVS